MIDYRDKNNSEYAENQTKNKSTILISDNGMTFLSKKL